MFPDQDTFVREWLIKYPEATIHDAEDQYHQEIAALDPKYTVTAACHRDTCENTVDLDVFPDTAATVEAATMTERLEQRGWANHPVTCYKHRGDTSPSPSYDAVVDKMTTEEKDDLVRAALKCMSELGREVEWSSAADKLDVFAMELSHSVPGWMPSITDMQDADAIRWWCDIGGHEIPDEIVEEDPSLAAEDAWNPEGYECDRCEAGDFPGHDCDDADEGNVDPGTCSREISCGAVRHDADCPIAFGFG